MMTSTKLFIHNTSKFINFFLFTKFLNPLPPNYKKFVLNYMSFYINNETLMLSFLLYL